jgi:hypothetical protein
VESKIVLQSSVANRTFGAVKEGGMFLAVCCTSKIWGCGGPQGLGSRCHLNLRPPLNELWRFEYFRIVENWYSKHNISKDGEYRRTGR